MIPKTFTEDQELLFNIGAILAGVKRPAGKAARSNPTLVARGDRPGQIAKAERILQQFQSRPVRSREERAIVLPEVVYAMGEPQKVYYYCDKRDPNDPEGDGRQGIWKLFKHEHDQGCGLRLYTTKAPPMGAAIIPGYEPMASVWPETVSWLGDFRGVNLTLPSGATSKITAPAKGSGRWGLYVMPDADALLALPYGPWKGVAYIWKGGHLTVTWRGIEG